MKSARNRTTVDVFHNILWSRYKRAVFKQLHALAVENDDEIRVLQFVEAASGQAAFGTVDLSYHDYPYQLLFAGGYDNIPRLLLHRKLLFKVLTSDATMIVLPSYSRPEHWLMLFATMLAGKRRTVCCDSTIHDQRQTLIKGWLKHWLFAQGHGFLAYGVRSREHMVEYETPVNRIFEPCQAVALRHDYDPDAAFLQRQHNVASPAEPVYLFVGRLAPEKSLLLLLDAFKQIHAGQPAATLDLIDAVPQRGTGGAGRGPGVGNRGAFCRDHGAGAAGIGVCQCNLHDFPQPLRTVGAGGERGAQLRLPRDCQQPLRLLSRTDCARRERNVLCRRRCRRHVPLHEGCTHDVCQRHGYGAQVHRDRRAVHAAPCCRHAAGMLLHGIKTVSGTKKRFMQVLSMSAPSIRRR